MTDAGHIAKAMEWKVCCVRARATSRVGCGLASPLFSYIVVPCSLTLRFAGVYRLPAYLAFLATTKYLASLEFLVMTLGPMFIAIALAERWHGRVAAVLKTFGRVPFFYYLLHIPLIHAAACVVSLLREGLHMEPSALVSRVCDLHRSAVRAM